MEEIKNIKKGNKNILIIIVAVLISLGAGFFGGIQYQKTRLAGTIAGRFQQGNYPSGSSQTTNSKTVGTTRGNQPVNGTITSIDNGSITIKTSDGGSKIITLSSSTAVKVTSDSSVSNLVKGDSVVVNGTTNSDGTVSAVTITIGGELMQLGGTIPQGQGPQGN